MGKLRRKALNQRNLPKQDQETMVICNYCNGSGKIIIEDDGRIYRSRICPFCMGSGAVTKDIYRACSRWLGILHHHQSKGLCK